MESNSGLQNPARTTLETNWSNALSAVQSLIMKGVPCLRELPPELVGLSGINVYDSILAGGLSSLSIFSVCVLVHHERTQIKFR